MSAEKTIHKTLAAQRTHYLASSLLMISASCVGFGIGIPAIFGWHTWPVVAPLIPLLFAAPLLYLSTRGKLDTSTEAHIYTALTILVFGAMAWLSGGLRSPVLYVLVFSAPMTVLQMSNRSSILWTALILLNVAIMALWDHLDYRLPAYLSEQDARYFSYLLIPMLIITLVGHLTEFQSEFIKHLGSVSSSNERLFQARKELDRVHGSFSDAASIISGARTRRGLLAQMQSQSNQGNKAFQSMRERLDSMFGSQEDIAMEVEQLARRSSSISVHLSTIKRVSTELDTMALNAALEAAHAQGNGKSFAPLAAAMRKLAESAIGEIQKIRKDIEFIVNHAERVDHALLQAAELGAEAYMSLDELSEVFSGALGVFEESTEAIDKAQNLGMRQLALMSDLIENGQRSAGA